MARLRQTLGGRSGGPLTHSSYTTRRDTIGKTAAIPLRANRRSPRRFDRTLYKARHPIGNFFARLKQFRAIAIRCDKTARNFLAAIHLTATAIWLDGRQAPAERRSAPFRLESTTDRQPLHLSHER